MADVRIGNAFTQKQREPIPEGGAWHLLYFMGFVFFIFLLTYVGLAFGYKNFLEARIQSVDEAIAAFVAANPDSGKQDEFLAFQAQLVNLKSILDKRVSPTKVLKLVESRTNARVYYTGLSLSFAEKRVEVEGIAPSYDVLAEQLQSYATLKEVSHYEVGGARLRDGGRVEFSVVLFLDESAVTL